MQTYAYDENVWGNVDFYETAQGELMQMRDGVTSEYVIYEYNGTGSRFEQSSWSEISRNSGSIDKLFESNGNVYMKFNSDDNLYQYNSNSLEVAGAFDAGASLRYVHQMENGKTYTFSQVGGSYPNYIYDINELDADGNLTKVVDDVAMGNLRNWGHTGPDGIGEGIDGPFIELDGKIYVQTSGAYSIRVLDPDAQTFTEIQTLSSYLGHAELYNGKIYAAVWNSGDIYVIDDGVSSVSTNVGSRLPSFVYNNMITYNGKMYVGGDNNNIYELDENDTWSIIKTFDSNLDGITIFDGKLQIAINGGGAYAFDGTDWEETSPDTIEFSDQGTFSKNISWDGAYYTVGTPTDIYAEGLYEYKTKHGLGELKVNLSDISDLTIKNADLMSDSLGIDAASIDLSDAGIATTKDNLEAALDRIKSEERRMSSNITLLETRGNFTDMMVRSYQEIYDDLTLVDVNEEAANLLALQTQQQLMMNALSFGMDSQASLLSLFR
ncbi:MAG: hypothetical protein ACTSXQ_04700 [Alphaproteobacteria bacterium]